MPSADRVRTTVSASPRVSPATKRSTTRRVAGVPTTMRRSAGRRDAASSALCISTGHLRFPFLSPVADTTTLGIRLFRDQRQTYDVTPSAFIHLYRKEGGC